MNTKWIIIAVIVIAIVLVGVIFAVLYFTTYNNLIALEETVNEKWAQVEQELQRRYDLIPRIVNASEKYIEYEGSILQNVTELRSQWAAAVNSGDPDAISNATANLEAGISNLIVVIEDYPQLESSEVIIGLMVELEGTENRISTERMRFNEAVGDYNRARRSFPANMWASGWGFEGRDYFEAKVGTEDPPQVPVD
jgi:LemA protein